MLGYGSWEVGRTPWRRVRYHPRNCNSAFRTLLSCSQRSSVRNASERDIDTDLIRDQSEHTTNHPSNLSLPLTHLHTHLRPIHQHILQLAQRVLFHAGVVVVQIDEDFVERQAAAGGRGCVGGGVFLVCFEGSEEGVLGWEGDGLVVKG